MKFETLEFVLAGLAGGGVGFISGVFGVGGGFLIVPVLNIVLGIEFQYAAGASVCQVLGPATTSLLSRRIRLDDFRLPLTISGGLLFGVFAGAQALESMLHVGKVVIFDKEVWLADLVGLAIYFVLLLSVGLFAIWEVHRTKLNRPLRRGWLTAWHIPPFASFPEFDSDRISIAVLAWFGVGVGFLSGLLGMSGGLVLLPGLIYLLGVKTHQSVISSLIIVWIISAQATAAHAWNGFVDLGLVMALLFGGTIGARLGTELSVKLRGPKLREGFGWLLLFTSAMIGFRLLWLLLP